MNNTGNLVLRQNDSVICRTTSQKHAQNPLAELLDSGNLVVRNDAEVNPGAYLWQSFDYPADTYLPGMKIGRDLKNGLDWRLNDSSPEDLSWGSVLSDYPEYSMMHGTEKFSRIGLWNGLYFSGVPSLKSGSGVELSYVANKDEIFYMSSSKDDSVIFSVVINQTRRVFNRHVWVEKDQNWNIFESLPSDVCDSYGLCGANGYCITTQSQIYQCLDGFSPNSPQAWNSSNWAQGCVRSEPLSCNIGTRSDDGFLKYTGLKVPDTTHTRLNVNINLGECRLLCLNNCSCMAYTNSDIGKGSGCVMWFGDLIDIKKFPAGGQDLYIRMAASELELQHQDKKKLIVAITIAVICGMLLLCIYAIYKVRRNIAEKSKTREDIEGDVKHTDLPLFDLLTITTATNNFLLNNKIGQGGFGPVYRAWRLWKEDKDLQLIDPNIKDSGVISEVMRCIHVSLLCVQ